MTDLATQVKAALESAGYEIREGKADLFDIEGAHKLAEPFGTCFGNNPAAPYIVPALPHRGEPYDYGPSMESKLTNDQGEKLYWTYRLEEHEAILMFGNLPPEAAFIGYEPFLFTRHFDSNNLLSPDMNWMTDNIGLQQHLSPNPDNLLYDHAPTYDGTDYSNDPNRVVLFANGPTINRRDLESLAADGNFWGQQAILSTSADAGFEKALNDALGEALANKHFHSPLGENIRLGLDYKADDFWTLMRYAVPVDPDAADKWRNNVANELVVLRVSKPGASVVRHSTYEFEPKAKATKDERSLAVDLQKIADAVGDALDFGHQEVSVPLSGTLHAPVSLPKAMSAVGATHDAHYGVSAARPFGEGEALAVVGVNHNRTANSSYISLGIYDASIWLGIRGISQALEHPNPGVLNDSAQRFFETLKGVPDSLKGTDLSNFYIHVVARPDAGLDADLMASTLCTVVEDESDQNEDRVELGLDKPIRMSERAYLNPDAHCGPDGKKLLSMLLLARAPEASQPKQQGRRSAK